MWPFSKKKLKIKTSADNKLDQINDLLFPPLEEMKMEDGTIYYIDYTIDQNLESVLTDIENGHVDKASIHTLQNALNRISKIRTILETYPQLKKANSYTIVDDGVNYDPVEDIVIKEN
jgi:hypothetical protein